ncbi:Bug family tripartite tricarboxylate transporter substrate binding protein [Caenimonas terrae]|uniref:Bug family tripartite tricarboxylate transporter substrate binding protein n=1 Tax=Caenimonas terrae TaxID=696074 RepID=A0ABW0NBJ7_9BURK
MPSDLNAPAFAPRRRALLHWMSAAALPALGAGALAQDPSRPIRLVVPFPAGGPTDALARLAADGLAAQLKQPVLVDNKAGAAGGIAADYVGRAPADGLTLLVAGQGLMFINKPLARGRKLGYDPDADFAYAGMLGSFPNVLVANPEAVPAQSLQELLAQARANPGRISYGSNGVGSLTHLSIELLASAADVKFLHVPYQGAAPQMADLMAGRIGFTLNGVQSVLQQIRAGKLRALAVTTATRYPELPNVPTLVESGFPALDLPVWFAVYAPAATPAPALARLREALSTLTTSPAYRAELGKRGAIAMPLPPAASEALFARERALWAEAVRSTGASAD